MDIFEQINEYVDHLQVSDFSKADDISVLGREVGDDRVDICRDPILLAMCLVVQERVFRMKTSKEDTFISREYWNFCELTIPLPTSDNGSIH